MIGSIIAMIRITIVKVMILIVAVPVFLVKTKVMTTIRMIVIMVITSILKLR